MKKIDHLFTDPWEKRHYVTAFTIVEKKLTERIATAEIKLWQGVLDGYRAPHIVVGIQKRHINALVTVNYCKSEWEGLKGFTDTPTEPLDGMDELEAYKSVMDFLTKAASSTRDSALAADQNEDDALRYGCHGGYWGVPSRVLYEQARNIDDAIATLSLIFEESEK